MKNGTVERERKLSAPDAFSLARSSSRLDPYVTSPVTYRRLHTIYYDTDDLRLTRWGCSLRFRCGEGWTLKIPVSHEGGALAREEHVFPGDDSTVPAGVLELATAYLRGAMPHPVAELGTLREIRHVRSESGEDVAELALDDVRVVDGTDVVRRFRQIEIELEDGAPDDALDAIGTLLRREGAGKPDGVAKNVRALGERAAEPAIDVPRLGRSARIGDVARAALAVSVRQLILEDTALRLHAREDAVHRARVAVRRIRSDLQSFSSLFDEAWASALRERSRWLQDGFSAARDGDVVLARLRHRTTELPERDRRRAEDALQPLVEARATAYDSLRAMLREPRYAALLQELVEAATGPPFRAAADAPAREAIPAIVSDVWSTLRKRVRARTRPPLDRELHEIRIAAKRVRYAAEAVVPVAGRRAGQLARTLEKMQTILGEQHDAVAARERLRALAAEPGTAFIAGALAALEHQAACDGRRAWRVAWRAAKRAYRRFAR